MANYGATFLGRESEIRYRIVSYEPPRALASKQANRG